MYDSLKKRLKIEIDEIKNSGRYKSERIITSKQKSLINTTGNEVINFCANNYLGLASKPEIIEAAKEALDPTVLVLHLLDLFVEHKIFIKN